MPTIVNEAEQHLNQNDQKRMVRWMTDGSSEDRLSSLDSSVGVAATATPKNNTTPSKRRVSSIKQNHEDNVVADYHFAGLPNTPWSKKKSRKLGRDNSMAKHASFGEKEMIGDSLIENSFHLGGSTSEIAGIYGNDLNASINSGSASGASSADPMNRTTLSDTHELSTSNFIMSTKVRGVLKERAQSLGMGNSTVGRSKAVVDADKVDLSSFGEGTMTLPDLTLTDLDEGYGRMMSQDDASEEDSDHLIKFTSKQASHIYNVGQITPSNNVFLQTNFHASNEINRDSFENSLAMDSNNDDELDGSVDFSFGIGSINSTGNENRVDNSNIVTSESPHADAKIVEMADTLKIDQYQKSFEESTASQNYLDDILKSPTDFEEHNLYANIDEAIDLVIENEFKSKSIESNIEGQATSNTDPKETIDKTPIQTQRNAKIAPIQTILRQSPSFIAGKKIRAMPLIRKSIGGDDLTNIRTLTASLRKDKNERRKIVERMSLPVGTQATEDDFELTDMVQSDPKETIDKTPIQTQRNAKIAPIQTILRQSPSFIAGKKIRAMPLIRKSIGGDDLTNIRTLTASLRKDKNERRKIVERMSLPVGTQATEDEFELTDMVQLEPAAPPQTQKSHAEVLTTAELDPPARNTHNLKTNLPAPLKDSPAKNTQRSKISQLAVMSPVNSPSIYYTPDTSKASPAKSTLDDSFSAPPMNSSEKNMRRSKRSRLPIAASLRKDKNERRKIVDRMSLPVGMQATEDEFELTDMVQLEPAAPPQTQKSHAEVLTTAELDPPARKTRKLITNLPAPLKDSPAKNTRRSKISQLAVMSPVNSPSISCTPDTSKASPAKSTADDSVSAPPMNSSEKNTRRSKKSRLPIESPANSPSMSFDSPARNTRNRVKSFPSKSILADSPPAPLMDSPARNRRSTKKLTFPIMSPANSPSVSFDSPARNTQSADKTSPSIHNTSDSSVRRKSKTTSASRNLFSQVESLISNTYPLLRKSSEESPSMNPPGDSPIGRRMKDSSLKDVGAPTVESLQSSEATDSLSLSREYPYLSLKQSVYMSPIGKSNNIEDKVVQRHFPLSSNISATELVQDFEGMTSIVEGGSLDEDDSNYSSNQVNAKRSETADLSDILGLIGDDPNDIHHELNKENRTPPAEIQTPRASHLNTPKSILASSQLKEGKRSAKKIVAFGATAAAIYNISSPSHSMTPMHPEFARDKYPVPSEKETEEEFTIVLEGDVTQMIAKASNPFLMESFDESRIESTSEFRGCSSSTGPSILPPDDSHHFILSERTEELETNIHSLINNNYEGSESFFSSVGEVSTRTTENIRTAGTSMSSRSTKSVLDKSGMSIEETLQIEEHLSMLDQRSNTPNHSSVEETQILAIEGTMTSLLKAAEGQSNLSPNDYTQTIELEGTFVSVLDDNRYGDGSEQTPLKQALKSLSPPKWKPSQVYDFTSAHCRKGPQPDEPQYGTCTILLDDNLKDLVHENFSADSSQESGFITFSKEHVSGLDDTVSELDMTTSNDLSSNSGVHTSLESIVEEAVELVELTLEELLENRADVLDHDEQSDVLLKVLNMSTLNGPVSSQRLSKDVLTQVCDDVEYQISTIDVESQLTTMLKEKISLVRNLKNRICQNDADTNSQLTSYLRAAKDATIRHWKMWITEVIVLYNDDLSNTVIKELEKESSTISDKLSLIERNREQLALPMLLRSARKTAKKKFQRGQIEVSRLEKEVMQLEAEFKSAQINLGKLQTRHGEILQILKSTKQLEILVDDESNHRQTADNSFFKFFSVEKLHNWFITSASDSFIGLIFRGSTPDANIHLSFSIMESSLVEVRVKSGPVPRSLNSLLGWKLVRHHPAVSGFFSHKISQLCRLIQNERVESMSKIPLFINFVEFNVSRIELAAEEFHALLCRCTKSFLQPSIVHSDEYEFHAYLTSRTRAGCRLQVTISISDCYPFAPIGVRLHASDTSCDTELMTRQVRKDIKPGYGALSRAIDVIIGLLD